MLVLIKSINFPLIADKETDCSLQDGILLNPSDMKSTIHPPKIKGKEIKIFGQSTFADIGKLQYCYIIIAIMDISQQFDLNWHYIIERWPFGWEVKLQEEN